MARKDRPPIDADKLLQSVANELREKMAQRVDKVSSGDEWQTRNLRQLRVRMRKGKP